MYTESHSVIDFHNDFDFRNLIQDTRMITSYSSLHTPWTQQIAQPLVALPTNWAFLLSSHGRASRISLTSTIYTTVFIVAILYLLTILEEIGGWRRTPTQFERQFSPKAEILEIRTLASSENRLVDILACINQSRARLGSNREQPFPLEL